MEEAQESLLFFFSPVLERFDCQCGIRKIVIFAKNE